MKSYVVKTGLIRLSYANIWEAKQDMSGRLKYSASLIIDGEDRWPRLLSLTMRLKKC